MDQPSILFRFHLIELLLFMLSAGALRAGDVPVNKQPVGALGSPEWVHAADIDSDGDNDLVTNSFTEGLDFWDNNGAQPPVFTRRPIDAAFTASRSAMTADVDRDGDLDVLAISFNGKEVAWWENSGARPPVWTKHTIAEINAPWSLYPADIDGDGDIDVAVAAFVGEIVWFESDGARPPAWTRQTVATGLVDTLSVSVADIDQDGHLDIVAASGGNGEGVPGNLDWWESDGAKTLSWTRHEIDANFRRANQVEVLDLDQDGDLDVVGGSFGDSGLSWWESNGAELPLWTRRPISTGISTQQVISADLDHDGDPDLIGAAFNAGRIFLWENDGATTPSWSQHVVADMFDPISTAVADIDGDGDFDLAGAGFPGELAWWENLTPGQVFFTGILDGASSIPAITPGGVFQAFLRPGTVPATQTSSAIPLSTDLGLSILVDGRPSPLFGAFQAGGFDQVNGVASWATPPDGRVELTVVPGGKGGGTPIPYSVRVTPARPGIYTFQFGVGPAIVQNLSDFTFAQPAGSLGSLNTRAANRGDVIIAWTNGLGPINGTVPDGDIPGLEAALLAPTKTVRVLIGGVEASIIGSPVLHPTLVALFQINAIVAQGTPTGDRVPIVIEVDCGGGHIFRSRRDVFIAVN
jgi:uncharacterized protein (TIGR03437 family)